MRERLSTHRSPLIALVALIAALLVSAGALSAQPDLPAPEDVIINGMVERQIGSTSTTNIQGTYYAAPTGTSSSAPGLLMLPQVSSFNPNGSFMADRGALVSLAQLFQANGFHVLTINLDGYIWDGNAADGLRDVQAAYNYLTRLPGVDVTRTAVFGASIGANYAMQLMAANPAIMTGVLLSPAPDYGGVITDPSALAGRSVITYYGTDETADPALAGYIDQFPSLITPTAGHGVALFADPTAAQQAVAGWVSIMDAPPDQGSENPFGVIVTNMIQLCNALFIIEGLGVVAIIRRHNKLTRHT